MKKILFAISLIAGLGLVSCQPNEAVGYDIEATVTLPNDGLQEVALTAESTEVTYQLMAYRSGYMEGTSTAEFYVDEAALTTYNETNGTSYTMLPADAYSFSSTTVVLDNENYTGSVDLTIDAAKAQKAAFLALPISVKSPDTPLGAKTTVILTTKRKDVKFGVTVDSEKPVEADGGALAYTVATNANWTYTMTEGAEAWAVPALNDKVLTLTFAANPAITNREGEITFTSVVDPALTQTFKFTQKGKVVQINVSSDLPDGTLPYAGGSYTVNVNCNDEWTYSFTEGGESWVKAAKSDAKLILTVSANATPKLRSTVLTITPVADPNKAKALTITQKSETPNADLLDVVFNADGTAYDASPLKNAVQYVAGDNHSIINAYDRYVASFNHAPGTKPTPNTGYYRVDYSKNETFYNGVSNGHSLEIFFCSNKNDSGKEVKPFSAMQQGGTGFLICKADQKDNAGVKQPSCITFLPNVSTDGSSKWKWCTSGITPEIGKYYHVVGIWDKENGKAHIYVNGELKNTIDAEGNLRHAADGAKWFAIGGDASNNGMDAAWNGNIVIARVYSGALSAKDVELLYKATK